MLTLDYGGLEVKRWVFYRFTALLGLDVSAIDIKVYFACWDLAWKFKITIAATDGGELGASYGELYASQGCACVIHGNTCEAGGAIESF